ncbi:MAG: Ku protein [Candidatus Saccharibacteria bacterium]
MRPLWKGPLSFGLVNIPIKIYVATEKKDLKFRYLHKECMTPVQYEKHCPTCDKPIENNDIVYGYEYQKGRFVVLNEEDFANIPIDVSKTIDILDFVDAAQVDPVYFDKSYFLEPSEGGSKAYLLLVKAMETTGKIAIARLVIRTKQNLAAVRVKDGVLMLQTMYYPDEVRSASGLDLPAETIKVHDKEVKMAVSLVESLSTDFEADKYQNEYRQALREMIEAKAEGQDIHMPPAAAPSNVVDLMEALKQSIKAAEQNRKKPKPKKAKVAT